MSVEPCSGVSSTGPSGVWEAARDHGLVRNRRDPSAWPSSGKDHRYKPMVKSCGGQRESDGVVVPVIGVNNAPGGKGPDFGRAGGGGKREGMTGTAGPTTPAGNLGPLSCYRFPPVGQVRELQRQNREDRAHHRRRGPDRDRAPTGPRRRPTGGAAGYLPRSNDTCAGHRRATARRGRPPRVALELDTLFVLPHAQRDRRTRCSRCDGHPGCAPARTVRAEPAVRRAVSGRPRTAT